MQEEVEKYKPRLDHLERIGAYLLEQCSRSDAHALKKEIESFHVHCCTVLSKLQTFQHSSQSEAIRTVLLLLLIENIFTFEHAVSYVT